jgi:5-methylcytosine-specific restriction endonuclease McrA
MKKCTKCSIIKPLEDFHKKAEHKKDGRASACAKCSNAYISAWQKANRPKCAARLSKWYKANRAKGIAYVTKYGKNNPGKINALCAKRHASKLQRTPKWLTSLHKQQITIFYELAAALTREFGIKMEVDHIIPLQGKNVSGLHVPWNLQVISASDNASKGNKCA